jgi:arabinan endo-1,5-alpha-L-arabinosidase
MYRKLLKLLFAAALLLPQCMALHAQKTTFRNPIIDEDAPDPTCMLAGDGFYYLYSTGAKIFKSADLVHWSRVGNCFTPETRPSFVPGVKIIWAPDINKIGNKYVLYYALSKWGGEDSCGIGIATAKRPEGPFININGTGKLFRSFEIGVRNSIDPCYVKDGKHQWLFWGSFSGIYAVELSRDGLSLKAESKPVKVAGSAYEGTWVCKRKGWYYLFASTGTCCEGARSTYRTVVGRSKNILGPYVDRQGRSMLDNHHEVLIHGNARWAGTGHNAELIEDKNGDTWIPYHAYDKENPKKGRVVLLDKVMWDAEGWPRVEGSEPSAESPCPRTR